MSYPLVRDLAAEGIPVRLTCGVLGHSRQAYYAWLAAPVSQRELEDAYLTNALIDAHADDPEFGYRFLADELERPGHVVGERRVWRLCSQQKLWSATVRKGRRGSGKTPGPAVHDDHLQRDFSAQRPDQIWVTDITEHPTAEGKLYCCRRLATLNAEPTRTQTTGTAPTPVVGSVDVEFTMAETDQALLQVGLDWPTPDDMDLELYYRNADGSLSPVASSGNFLEKSPTYELRVALYAAGPDQVVGGLVENWTLSCAGPDGTIHERVPVVVDRGQQVKVDMKKCSRALTGL